MLMRPYRKALALILALLALAALLDWTQQPRVEPPPASQATVPGPSPSAADPRPDQPQHARLLRTGARPRPVAPPRPTPAAPAASPARTPRPVVPAVPALPAQAYPQARPAARRAVPHEEPRKGQPAAAPFEAQEASAEIARLVRATELRVYAQGTGDFANLVRLDFQNTSEQPLHVRLVPGMVLQPPAGQGVQPLLLEETVDITLAPGQTWSREVLSYCLDVHLPAPAETEMVNYRFVGLMNSRQRAAARLLQAAATLEMHPVLRARVHRYLVIQLALWQALGQHPRLWLDRVLLYLPERGRAETKASIEQDAARLIKASTP